MQNPQIVGEYCSIYWFIVFLSWDMLRFSAFEVKGLCSNLQTLALLRKNMRQAHLSSSQRGVCVMKSKKIKTYFRFLLGGTKRGVMFTRSLFTTPRTQEAAVSSRPCSRLLAQIMLASPLCDGPGFVREKYEPGALGSGWNNPQRQPCLFICFPSFERGGGEVTSQKRLEKKRLMIARN